MKFLMMFLTALTLSACGKSVSSTNGDGTNLTTPQSPVAVPVASPTPTSGATTNPINSSQTLIFANHGEINTSQNLYTTVRFSVSETVYLPASGILTSYSTRSDLLVYINGSRICTYRWSGSSYLQVSGCQSTVSVVEGDLISMTGMPQTQTATMTITTQR